MKPTISIIIPAYNHEDFVAECIDSALNQTVKPHEIILVDDGSTDKTAEIALRYPIKVIRQVNKGLPSARNTGIMNATGDYIMPLDSDDMLSENAVELVTNKIVETGSDIIAPSIKCFGIENREVILQGGLEARSFAEANRIAYFSTFRRSKALEIGGYSPRMFWGYEDYHFWIDLLKRGATITVMEEPLLLYRTRANSMISSSVKHHEELMAQIRKDHNEIYS